MMAPAFATAFGFNGSPLIRLLTIRRSAPENFDDEDADEDGDDHEVEVDDEVQQFPTDEVSQHQNKCSLKISLPSIPDLVQ